MTLLKNFITRIGITGKIVIVVFITLYSYLYYQKLKRSNHSAYSNGFIYSKTKGAKGNINLNYFFEVDNNRYEGLIDVFFCRKYNCCSIGDPVTVRYEIGNPQNNDLVNGY